MTSILNRHIFSYIYIHSILKTSGKCGLISVYSVYTVYSTVQYSTYCTVQYCTVQYSVHCDRALRIITSSSSRWNKLPLSLINTKLSICIFNNKLTKFLLTTSVSHHDYCDMYYILLYNICICYLYLCDIYIYIYCSKITHRIIIINDVSK